jgi:creatinine amidohydrolase
MEGDVHYLSRATWVTVEESIKTGNMTKVIVPIGSLEQHGPHLPLSTDTTIADYVATRVTKRCQDAFLMPPIQLGCSGEHLGFPGTISLQPETVSNMILDISDSLLKSKLNELYIINGHGGNKATLDAAITKVKLTLPEMQLYSFTIIDIVKEKFDEIRKSSRRLVGHADEIETSMMLAIQPETVDMSKAIREEPSLPRGLSFEREDLARVSFGWTAKELTRTGVMGDPQVANAETGKVLLDFAVDVISNAINEL